jgi:hypothetical protein
VKGDDNDDSANEEGDCSDAKGGVGFGTDSIEGMYVAVIEVLC